MVIGRQGYHGLFRYRRGTMSDTLFLNSTYEPMSVIPLSVISWQRAMKLLFLERVKVLAHYDDWTVHSQKCAFPVPALVITTEYFDFKKSIRYSKHNVYLRDLYQCQYCGDTFDPSALTIDHVIPRAMGGKTTWENVVAACKDCNSEKADKMEMSPLRDPFRPDARQMMFAMRNKPYTAKHPSWKEYLEPYRKIA